MKRLLYRISLILTMLTLLVGEIGIPVKAAALTKCESDAIFFEHEFYDREECDSGYYNAACGETGIGDGISGPLPDKWKSLLEAAAAEYKVDARVLAGVLFAENNGSDVIKDPSKGKWPNPDRTSWPGASAHPGSSAEGAFQILDGTWEGIKVDADGGGASRQSIVDSAYSAAKYLSRYAAGKMGVPAGSPNDDMSKSGITDWSTAAKIFVGYNAGSATYRDASGTWMEGSAGPWKSSKQKEISDYILKGIIGFQTAAGETPNAASATDPSSTTNGSGCSLSGVVGGGVLDVVYYSQGDPRWHDYRYGDGNMAQNGCGPTSLAMIFSTLLGDPSITPDKVADYNASRGFYAPREGTSWTAFTETPKHWGLTGRNVGKDLQAVADALEAGSLVIVSFNPGHFTEGGHIAVIRGITAEGKVLVNDPADGQPGSPNYQRKTKTEWDQSIIMGEAKGFWIISK